MIIRNFKVKNIIKKAKTTFCYTTINSRVLPNLQSPSSPPPFITLPHKIDADSPPFIPPPHKVGAVQ